MAARWALRAVTIIAVGVGGTVAGMYAIGDLSSRTYLAATLAGFIPVVALVWLLATQFRRR